MQLLSLPRGLGRVLRTTAFSVVALASITTQIWAEEPSRELRILNWSEYLDPDLVAKFEAQFNVKVREYFYENDEARDEIMIRSGGEGYDVMIVDGTSLAAYRSRDWLEPIPPSAVPNLKHIDPRWIAHEGAQGYAAPYFWGTLGIAYRADLVPTPITSWRDLMEPTDLLSDRIVMIQSARDLISAALLALGHSVNATDPDQLRDAQDLLAWQKPYVKDYSYVSITEESELVTGEVWAAMMYNGDALVLQEYNENITYIAPDDGTVIWVDYWTVLSTSQNKDVAFQFINFMNEAENAAQMAQYVYYASPNRAAEALLPEEFLEEESIYPSQAVLNESEFYENLRPRDLRRYVTIRANIIR